MRLYKYLIAAALMCVGLFCAGVAHAEPVSTAIATVLVSWGASATAAAAIAAFAVRTLITIGVSLLTQALNKQGAQPAVGIKTTTSAGGTVSQTFILGEFMTAGHRVAPMMSYGQVGKTPNAYLVDVVALGCIPGETLNQIIIYDEYVDIGPAEVTIPGTAQTGFPLGGIYAGNAWIRYHDGNQTVADALLLAKFAAFPDRPWTSFMVGRGRPYAVLVFKYNREIYNNTPTYRFVMGGIPLYDPRHDSSVGGSGSQRWGDESTYVPTTNLVVHIYNIHRGITLPDGDVWGGEAEAEDLPLDNWFAAMNDCDVAIDLDEGGTEPAYRGGAEVSLATKPADVMEELAKACQAQQVEIGGIWKIRIGGPGLPVFFFTDDDILVDHDQAHDMFPGLDQTHNGIQASHPLPSALWSATDAPARYSATLEADDGNRRLIADLTLPCVYSPTQVQRIMQSSIDEERRFRRHSLSFGPYASMLEPLDSTAWTSARESYTGKVFEVAGLTEGIINLTVTPSLRERDAGDFTPPSFYLPWPAAIPGAGLPVAQAVPGWTVTGTSVKDAANNARRPALALEWDGDELPDVRAVMWEVRVAATLADVASGTASNVAGGGILVSEGMLPSTEYQARARLVVDRPTDWTSWIAAITPDVRLSGDDLPPDLLNLVNSSALDLIKLWTSFEVYKQITDGLLYHGDGRSLQLVSTTAETKAVDALYKFSLLGALNADSSAYLLNTSFVKINESTTMAGFVNTVSSSIGSLTSSVTEVATAVDGVRASHFLKVQAGNRIAGIYASADDEAGTSSVGVIAQKFFVADDTDPDNIIEVFQIADGRFRIHSNFEVNGGSIFNGSVTIQKVAVNTFLVPSYAETATGFHGDGSTLFTLCSTTVTLQVTGIIEATACLFQGFPAGDAQWDAWLYVNGATTPTSYVQGAWTQVSVSMFNVQFDLPAGTYTVEVKWKGGSTIENVVATVFAKGIQKVE